MFEKFQLMHANLRMVESSPARAIRGRPGVHGIWTRDPCHWLGGPCTRKKLFKLGSKPTRGSHNTQKSFGPNPRPPPCRPARPPPPSQEKWHPVAGAGRGQNRKIEVIHWGIMSSPKMMVIQGVGHPISPIGVCCADDPPKMGEMAPMPTLDPTTPLWGDFPSDALAPMKMMALIMGALFQTNPLFGGGAPVTPPPKKNQAKVRHPLGTPPSATGSK